MMMCDDCGEREAHIHIMRIGPDGRMEKNLCEQCAANYGEFMMPDSDDEEFSINDFLKGLFGHDAEDLEDEYEDDGDMPDEVEENEKEVSAPAMIPAPVVPVKTVCPRCHMTLRDFGQTGSIGCSECLEAFRGQLEPLYRKIYGGAVHSGKIPKRSYGVVARKHEITRLRAKLKESVEREEYERAAGLRDRIRQLEAADKGSAVNGS